MDAASSSSSSSSSVGVCSASGSSQCTTPIIVIDRFLWQNWSFQLGSLDVGTQQLLTSACGPSALQGPRSGDLAEIVTCRLFRHHFVFISSSIVFLWFYFSLTNWKLVCREANISIFLLCPLDNTSGTSVAATTQPDMPRLQSRCLLQACRDHSADFWIYIVKHLNGTFLQRFRYPSN